MATYYKKSGTKKLLEEAKEHYSDKELEGFKKILLRKREKALKILTMLDETCPKVEDCDSGEEISSTILEKAENRKLADRQIKLIGELDSALLQIEDKSYGICKATGKLIPKDRLCIVPHASMSIEAKRQQPAPTPTPVPPEHKIKTWDQQDKVRSPLFCCHFIGG